MRFGSLFAGIGGLDLGVECSGLATCVWQVEIDEFCRAILAKHWPYVDRSVTDVRQAGADNLARVDGVVLGFPCQDVSGAGKGAGLAGTRSGLWFEALRIIQELRPWWVIIENVASGARRWVSHVRHGLRDAGYRTRALQVSAADVGAPHLRKRIFVLAYAHGEQLRQQQGRFGWEGGQGTAEPIEGGAAMAYADGYRQPQSKASIFRERGRAGDGGEGVADPAREGWARGAGAGGVHAGRTGPSIVSAGASQPGVGGGAYGLPRGLDAHRWPAPQGPTQFDYEPPRTLGGAHVLPTLGRPLREHRAKRLKALGNAVVPQCAEVAARVLMDWMNE